MGVNLSELVSGRQIELSDLKGRMIAIDAYNTLYQFLSIIRDRFTGEPLKDSKGRITSHLSGLFYRTTNLLENGIDPVFVFDGKPPAFKHKTAEKRSAIKKEAEAKLEKAREEGDAEAIRRYAQATSKLTGEMIESSKRLLELMGVAVLQAPSEGEAQAAYMANAGVVWASGSQDWDSLLFGANRMIKNLTVSGRRKIPRKEDYVEIRPEIIELETRARTARHKQGAAGNDRDSHRHGLQPRRDQGNRPEDRAEAGQGKEGFRCFLGNEMGFRAERRRDIRILHASPRGRPGNKKAETGHGKAESLHAGF